MWTVTLFYAPEFVAETGIASTSQDCEFWRIGETIMALTNKKDEEGLGEISKIEVVLAYEYDFGSNRGAQLDY